MVSLSLLLSLPMLSAKPVLYPLTNKSNKYTEGLPTPMCQFITSLYEPLNSSFTLEDFFQVPLNWHWPSVPHTTSTCILWLISLTHFALLSPCVCPCIISLPELVPVSRKTCAMLHLQPLHEAQSRGNPGTGEMSQAKECLLCKPEHLTLIPSAHIKRQTRMHMPGT